MAYETVEHIKNAETQAAEVVAKAKKEAELVAKNAQSDAKKVLTKMRNDAVKYEKKVLEKCAETADGITENAKQLALAECEKLESKAAENRNAAVKKAVEIIFEV